MSVNLKQNADGSAGLEGNTNKDAGEFIYINANYNTNTPLTISAGMVTRPLVVQKIYCMPDTASSNAVTATVYKAASGTALGSGTALHTGTFNLQGTAATTQELTLSSTATTLAEDSHIGIVISGALGAAGSGVVTIACTPA